MATDDQPAAPAATADPADEELTGEALVRWWRVPLSLRIVAYAFILGGVLGVEEMLLDWFVFDAINVNLSFVGIFIGRGLLRWRESSRGWAVFFTWILLVLFSLWLVSASYFLLSGPMGSVSANGASLEGVSIGGGLLGFLVWQLRVLRRPDIVERFKAPRLERLLAYGGRDPAAPRGRWQFSLGGLLVMTAIVAFGLARIGASDVLYTDQQQSTTWAGSDGVRCVNIVYQTPRFWDGPDRLLCAVLSADGVSMRTRHSSYHDEVTLIAPDGRELPLPSGAQLYEVVDGELRSRDERVTLEELQDYLASNPDEWSLDALVQHAEQMRQQHAAAKSPGGNE